MRKTLIIIFGILLSYYASVGQEKTNTIYFEAGGNTIYYSINYDRIFKISEKLKIAPRIGFMYLPLSKIYDNNEFGNVRIPLEVNLLWSIKPMSKNFIESGIGLNMIMVKQNVTYIQSGQMDTKNTFGKVATIRVGFRHQKPTGGFMYRIGVLVPIAQDDNSNSRFGDDLFYRIWPGASLGYTF